MHSKLIDERLGERTFALVFAPGEEVAAGLLAFAREANLAAAHFTAIGAFSDVVLGFFDPDRKEYLRTPVREQVEVVSLVGNVAQFNREPKVHAHVRPTLEVVVVESPHHLRRATDPATGLALPKLDGAA